MPERVRRLTGEGMERFRGFLGDLRGGSAAAPPRELLTDLEASAPFGPEVMVEERDFRDRLEAAAYLDGVFEGIEGLEEDVGLWSWLSLFYFDQVCPPGEDGRRSPGRDYRHILEPGYRYGHRHLLKGPFLVFRLHGERARLLLWSKVHKENKFHHELASRQAFITNPAVLDAVSLLYLDERKGRPKRGAQATKGAGGTLRRFIAVVQQLDLNYDLYSMTGEAIVGLLPKEFDPWKPKKGIFRRRKRK